MRVSRVAHDSQVEGPGRRSVMWVQGCSIRCHGCINPQLFDPNGGIEAENQEFIEAALESGAEGITVLGGEPFDQPDGLADLSKRAHDWNLGVIIFTGYEYESLLERGGDTLDAIEFCDLLIDGRFDIGSPDAARSLVGSTNQRFIQLSDRYSSFDPKSKANRVELVIRTDGSVDVSGFLSSKMSTELRGSLDARRHIRHPRPLRPKE